MSIQRSKVIQYSTGVFAIFGLLFLAALYTFHTPVPDTSATTASSKVSLAVESLLALTLSTNDITFSNVNPGTSGTFVSDDVTANVKTNNATGYTLTMSSKTNETAMTRTDTKPYTIPSITADTPVSTAATSFTNNTWGWYKTIDSAPDTNYHPIPLPTSPATIREIDHVPTTDLEKNTDVTTGIKIGPDLPAGTYANTLTFSLVANYVPRMNAFWQANTMQDFTQQTCDAETTPTATATTIVTTPDDYTDPTTQVPQRTLQDTRDNKYYLIRKLADGNCWMVQNLDLELAGKALTDQDTDLNSKASWSGAVAVQLGDTWAQADYDTARYYSHTSSQTGDTYWTNGGIDMTVNPGTQTTWTGSFPNNLDPTPTYLAGNYYTWPAATAGSVDASYNETSKEAPDSICPKGWRLPLNEGEKSWYNLLVTTYSIANSVTGSESILSAPMSFVRSGNYGYNDGLVLAQGKVGFWWSSVAAALTVNNGANAKYLAISQGGMRPQGNSSISYGISVRCVTR